MRICPNCHEENPDRAKFCLNCAQPLSGATAGPRETRKTVTVLFADVSGSTGIGEKLDPESLRRVMGGYFEKMRAVIERHGGTVEKFIGDAVMAVFGIPVLHEDDALRAVRAAVEMQAALTLYNQELQRERGVSIAVRTGINTGEVVAGIGDTGHTLVTGDPVNVAARFEQTAGPDEVLIGDETYRLVRDAVEVEPLGRIAVKGKSEPVSAFKLIRVISGVEGFTRHFDSPMVGRENEKALLTQAYERVRREGTSHLFTVLGSVGVGKSRLVSEFLTAVEAEAVVLQGRCLNYGEGITFYPVAEVVKKAAGIVEEDSAREILTKLAALIPDDDARDVAAQRLAQMMGVIEATASPEEIAWAVRKLLEALARKRPVVVLFDDIHWGEPTFLDLVEQLADWSRDAPILLVCNAREELLDKRPGWGGGKMNVTSILLEPLTGNECGILIENLLGQAGLAADVTDRISAAAEGNPLFVEQMLSMLIDEGGLVRDRETWISVGDLNKIAVPPTVQALIAARVDRLPSQERRVIERAAIAGTVFYWDAVSELSPEDERSTVGTSLMALVRKELIRPERSDFAGQEAFRFRHIVIRDAAYEAMPKETRAERHERFAGWLEGLVGERVMEYEEILGFHLEEAHRYLVELGRSDDLVQDLGRGAAERLARAARRALLRGDPSAAAQLLGQIDRLIEPDDLWCRASLTRATALNALGETPAATEIYERVRLSAAQRGDQVLESRALLGIATAGISMGRDGSASNARAVVERVVPLLQEAGDDAGLAQAWNVLADVGNNNQALAEMEQAAEKGLWHARKAGDAWAIAESIDQLGIAFMFGPKPADLVFARLEGLLEEVSNNVKAQATILFVQGFTLGVLGEFDRARQLMTEGQERLIERGYVFDARAFDMARAAIELKADNPAGAEAVLMRACELFERQGALAYLSTAAATLAEALYVQGRLDDALHWANVSASTTADDDMASHVAFRSVLSKILARKGDIEAATRIAEEVLELADRTPEASSLRADCLKDVAETFEIIGDPKRAVTLWRGALEEYGRKKDLSSIGHIQLRLDLAENLSSNR
ncbi:MAG: AAA family ATPase [Actinomycetota bacterium]|nr:AAA family ATPase [Actinomycetota bacterium]